MSKELKNMLISYNQSLLQAMKLIDANSKGILLVIKENNILVGTITDGDVRRAILSGHELNMSISKIYNRNCIYAYENVSIHEIKQNFIEKKIRLLPIVDKNKKIVDYYEIDDMIDYNKIQKENKVLIMAGGLGTRLKPFTNNFPKPMLKVGSKPILETIIEQFRDYGFSNILISVNYKAEIIENYFGNGENFGVSIKYIKEDKRLGTAGAIRLAEKYLDSDKAFFVINGDVLTNLNFYDLLKYHSENNYKMTIGSRIYETQIPFGVINTEEACVTSLEEKPVIKHLVSGGVYVLNPEVIENIPNNEYFDITQLIDIIIKKKNKVGSFPITDYWIDIGRLDDYYKANNEICNLSVTNGEDN